MAESQGSQKIIIKHFKGVASAAPFFAAATAYQRERINVDSLLNIGKYPKDKILKNAVGNDIILVNKTKLTFAPNTITQAVNKRGGITRNNYGKTGVQIKQISKNDLGHIKESKLGKHGEHAHDYHFDNDKKRTVHEKARELTSEERKENSDFI